MFVQPDQITIVLGWLRECAIIGTLITLGWKARGVFQNIIDFQNSISKFMKRVDGFMLRMETNHFKHMEAYLKKMAGDPPVEIESDSESLPEADPDAS